MAYVALQDRSVTAEVLADILTNRPNRSQNWLLRYAAVSYEATVQYHSCHLAYQFNLAG